MSTTPILTLTVLVNGQAIPEVVVNENTRWLEFFAAGGAVEDRDDTAPPGSPVDGEAYLVAATATGAWAGHDGEIAQFISTAWEFKAPTEGLRIYVKDEDLTIVFNGSTWNAIAGATYTAENARDDVGAALTDTGLAVVTVNDGADTIDIDVPAALGTDLWTGTSTAKAVTPAAMLDSAKFQTLTDGATITPDFGAGFNFKVTLGGNRTLANPSNAKDGQSGVIRLIQDGTGSRTLAYGSNWRFAGGASANALSTAASSIDVLSYIVGEGGLIYATLSKAFAA